MKKTFALFTLGLMLSALVLTSCGSKKTSCAAYNRADVQTVEVDNDLALN
jgi:hypothetical protein